MKELQRDPGVGNKKNWNHVDSWTLGVWCTWKSNNILKSTLMINAPGFEIPLDSQHQKKKKTLSVFFPAGFEPTGLEHGPNLALGPVIPHPKTEQIREKWIHRVAMLRQCLNETCEGMLVTRQRVDKTKQRSRKRIGNRFMWMVNRGLESLNHPEWFVLAVEAHDRGF